LRGGPEEPPPAVTVVLSPEAAQDLTRLSFFLKLLPRAGPHGRHAEVLWRKGGVWRSRVGATSSEYGCDAMSECGELDGVISALCASQEAPWHGPFPLWRSHSASSARSARSMPRTRLSLATALREAVPFSGALAMR